MAKLVSCGVCGQQVSTTATQCPSCGAKFKKKTSIITWLVLVFIGIPILWAVFAGATSKNNTSSQATTTTTADKSKEKSVYETMDKYAVNQDKFDEFIGSKVAVVQMLVKQQMKDGDSAEFRNWTYVKASKDLPPTICGEVNGKNSFNAKAGFRRFLFKTDTTEFASDNGSKEFDKIYQKYCVLK